MINKFKIYSSMSGDQPGAIKQIAPKAVDENNTKKTKAPAKDEEDDEPLLEIHEVLDYAQEGFVKVASVLYAKKLSIK
jgi:hypothetical protein